MVVFVVVVVVLLSVEGEREEYEEVVVVVVSGQCEQYEEPSRAADSKEASSSMHSRIIALLPIRARSFFHNLRSWAISATWS